ncbi:MAG: carboxymuconolactone decarboxylase family protein, partial [Myxococcota bacterium]
LELLGAIGTWRFVSQLLRSLEVPLEEGVAPWPPDGLAGGA